MTATLPGRLAMLERTLPGSSTRGISAFALFAAIQVADTILTLIGINRFGPAIEGNPVLSFVMVAFGTAATLMSVKAVALAGAFVLHLRAQYLALALLSLLYVFGAIIPWMWLLAL